MQRTAIKSFKLGKYLVQPEHNKIRLNDEVFKIEPKIMQVLCCLVENKREVVSRAQIAKTLWPDSVTGLEVVTRAIFELRKTLNDDPKNPTYIETIARKGYCFISDPEEVKTTEPAYVFSHFFIKYFNQLMFIVISIGVIVATYVSNVSPNRSFDMKSSILTDSNIYADMPAISPDQKQLLFIKKQNSTDKTSDLVLLELITQKQTNITNGDAEYKTPVWSKNSEYWYYVRCRQTSLCEIIKHHINKQKIETILSLKYNVFSIAFSSDNKYLSLALLKDSRAQLALVDLTSSGKSLNYIKAPEEHNSNPIFSLDNQSVYFVSTIIGSDSQLYRYDIFEQNTTKISDNYSRISGLAIKDEYSLWVSGTTKNIAGIWEFNLSQHSSVLVFESFKGHLPSYVNSQENTERLIYKNSTRTIHINAMGISDIGNLMNANSSMVNMRGVYSAKSRALYFVSNRSGSFELWRFKNNSIDKMTNIDASMIERPILNLQQDKLAFLTRAKIQPELSILDLKDLSIKKSVHLPKKSALLSWSNDQDNIYFGVFENQQYNVYKLNVHTGEKQKILLNAGAIVQESEDGRSLYYVDTVNQQLVHKLASGEIKVLFKMPKSEQGLKPHNLKLIDDKIFYVSQQQNKNSLKYYSTTEHVVKEYMTLPAGAFVSDIVDDDTIGVIFSNVINRNAGLIELTK
jgi:DNA-binding winged helix-turn-helix (wHTH) protein/Tol biopolymer transport system component